MEFSDFLDRVEKQFFLGLPFVAYRKPDRNMVKAIFQRDADIRYVKDFKEKGFVFAPFDDEKPTLLLSPDEACESVFEVKTGLDRNIESTPKIDINHKKFHINLVEKGIDRIKKGNLKKVVLTRKVKADSKASPLTLFQSLLEKYPTALCYLWYHPKVGMWLGATPETLIKVKDKKISTISLAGTKAYLPNERPIWGQKELEEQELVTKYISDALEDKTTDLEISGTESVRAGNLWHLRTRISGDLEREDLSDIVKELHPTPAVCGLPKERAKSFILENENYNREYYTGFLGELNFPTPGNLHLFVNLRCMQLQDKKAIIYLGGGITKDSDPESEWEETVAKSKTMLDVLFNSPE